VPEHTIDKRWWALTLLCLGELMIVLDTTIVNVALPSIRADLGFTETSLVWVVNGNEAGWASMQTLGLLAAALALLASFLVIEARVSHPLMPLGLFKLRSVAVSNIVGMLWAAAMFAWFFISALYMQLVLGYSAMQVGLAFLPSNLIMAALSLGWSATLVMRFGIRGPLAVGLLMAALGLALFARAPVDGHFLIDVLPGMLLLGLGVGVALNPVLLAVLASGAAARTSLLSAAGAAGPAALHGGYQLAFVCGALFAALAALLGFVLLRADARAPEAAKTIA